MFTFKDFMQGHDQAVIYCLMKNEVVRQLVVTGTDVYIDVLSEIVTVPLEAEIRYEPWELDRGSLCFMFDGQVGKLCTEYDYIHFPNEKRTQVTVPDGIGIVARESQRTDTGFRFLPKPW